ncbi:MAG: DUF3344 domain-containing protein, partial [Thermodesulfobacteriota bacterium]|nr:DUF3344 domain-containing protein [Thermodesulfobacteriota bacterium]
MKTGKNGMLAVVTLIGVITFVGGVQAATVAWGEINSTAAEGEIVEVWLDVNPSDYVTVGALDGDPDPDYWYVADLTPMLDRNGYTSGDTGINVTAAIYCSGTQRDIDGVNGSSYANTYENVTLVQFTVDYADGSYQAPLMNLTTCPAETHPDLIVASITPNCGGYLFGNESNTISAKIENIGNGAAVASTACFALSDGHSATISISLLAAGANETVTITDPTIRSAGAAVTITVTADCNAEVAESNETNNVTTLDVIVVNNGYKGKTYTGGSNMTTWEMYDLNGSLIYSPGDSYYLSSYAHPDWTTYNASWTAGNLSVTGTVVEARLYMMYTWDKKDVMSNNVNLTFNGFNQVPEDAHYWDEKGFGTSYPYGMLVYNVTSNFSTAGNYANLTNNHLGGGNVSMRGMMLVAIYEDANEPHRQIFV